MANKTMGQILETNRKEFWIKDSSESDTTKKVIETITTESFEGQSQSITIITCRSCCRVLHSVEEIRALCGVCKEPLCEKDAENICAVCGRSVCREDTSHTLNNKAVCITHGLFRRLFS